MSASIVQSVASAENVNSLAYSSNVTSGNLLVAILGVANSGMGSITISDTVGSSWTQGTSPTGAIGSNASNQVAIFFATAGGSGANTVTTTGMGATNACQIILVEVSGTFTTFVDNYWNGGGTNASNPASITLSQPGDLVFTGCYYSGITTPTVSGGDSVIVSGLHSDRSITVAWAQPVAAGSYTSTLSVGTVPAFVTIAFRNQATTSQVRQVFSSNENTSTAFFLNPVVNGNLLLVILGQANGSLLNPNSLSDTVGTTYVKQALQNAASANGVALYSGIATGGGTNKVTVASGFGTSSCYITVIEVQGTFTNQVDASGNGTSAPTLTLTVTNDLVFTASYYTGNNTAATISSGSEVIINNKLASDRNIAICWEQASSSGSFTSALSVDTSPAFISVAFKATSAAVQVFPNDKLSLVDSLKLIGGDPNFHITLGDNLANFQDSNFFAGTITQKVSDNFNTLLDAAVKLVGIPIQAFDSQFFNWGDSVSKMLVGFLNFIQSDNLSLSDFTALNLTSPELFVHISDNFNTIQDAIRFTRAMLNLVQSDQLVLNDQLMMLLTMSAKLADFINTIADAAGIANNGANQPHDTMSISDSISIVLATLLQIKPGDSLVLNDFLVTQLGPGSYNPADILRIRRYLDDVGNSF